MPRISQYKTNEERRVAARQRRRKYSENNREALNQYFREYAKNHGGWVKPKPNKLKNRARHKLQYAVFMKRIIRPEMCQKCNKQTKTVAHHYDYRKPYDVVWLCTACHGLEHRICD